MVKEHTEKLSPVQRYLPFSMKGDTQFWSQFSGDETFKLLKKWNAKGYTNSFAPWLVGRVKPDQAGCSIRISFELDKWVSRLNRLYFYMLVLFTVIIGLPFVRNIFSGELTGETIVGAVVISIFWIFLYGLRKVGFHFGQQEKTTMVEFVENLFANYKVT